MMATMDSPASDHTRPPHPPQPARRIVREPDDSRLAGVCAGLADHLGVDVTVLRVSAVVLALITPLALVAYLVASIALPERRPDEPRVRAARVHLDRVPHPLIAVGAVVAVVALVDDAWWLQPFPAAMALIGLGVWLVLRARGEGSGDAAQFAPSPSTTAPGAGPPPGPPSDALSGAETPSDAAPPFEATTDASDRSPIDRPLRHPMADSPWLVSVSQHSSTEGDSSTTLADVPPPVDRTDAPPGRDDAGSSGEFPPPNSPWWSGAEDDPAETSTPPERTSHVGSIVLALLMLAAGALWLLDALDAVDVSLTDALAGGLVLTGIGLLVGSWTGRTAVLVPVALVLAGLLAVDDGLPVPLDAGIGDRTTTVGTTRGLQHEHQMLIGELDVDLTDAPLPTRRPARVEAAVGMGELRVIVPRDATVVVDAEVTVGEVRTPGSEHVDLSGVGLDEDFTLPGGPDGPWLELDLSVGFGSVEVARG